MMIYDKYKLFQSTLLQEERHKLPGLSVMNRYISIHAPTRGATFPISSRQWTDWNFNPRSYKRSDYAHGLQMPLILYFNPRSYKRSDCARKSDQVLSVISIHAPTRGATDSCRLCVWIDIISIHAPTRGATIASHKVAMLFMYFNPRSYKRSDGLGHTVYDCTVISIHAPTRGATCFAAAIAFSRSYFNPRSYKRSDSARCKCENRSNNFNPRSYKRSDWLEGEKLTQLGISIHAPTRGATALAADSSTLDGLFQSTLLQEERL